MTLNLPECAARRLCAHIASKQKHLIEPEPLSRSFSSHSTKPRPRITNMHSTQHILYTIFIAPASQRHVTHNSRPQHMCVYMYETTGDDD